MDEPKPVSVAVDAAHTVEPVSGGYVIEKRDRTVLTARSRTVYPTTADALRALVDETVMWDHKPGPRSRS